MARLPGGRGLRLARESSSTDTRRGSSRVEEAVPIESSGAECWIGDPDRWRPCAER